jgi:hypothetical protein
MNINVGQASRLPSEHVRARNASASPMRAGETPALRCRHPRLRGSICEILFEKNLREGGHRPAELYAVSEVVLEIFTVWISE